MLAAVWGHSGLPVKRIGGRLWDTCMSKGTPLDDLLRRTELFSTLDNDDRAACADAFRARGDRAYLVEDGLVRLTLATAGGRELNVRVAGPGDMIGEIAVLDSGPRTADATALTDVTAYAIKASSLTALFHERPGMAQAVIALLCKRLRATTAQMEGIALHRIEVRLARFLLEQLATRPASSSIGRVPLELGYSQGELARLVGASRPKLNVALGVLEKTGAIKRTSDRLFCDREALTLLVEGHGD